MTVSGSATNAPAILPVLQVTPGSIAYGTILSGTGKTNSFTVANAGNGTLSGVASVSAPFSIVSGGSYNLGAGQSQAVVVVFSPSVASNYNQSVTFSGGSGTNVTVSGSATNAPAILPVLQVTPGSIAYGTILSGTGKTNSFTVANAGNGTLSGVASVSAPFSIVSGGSYNLGAGQSQAVVVVFSPSVASNYNQSVTFSGGSGTNVTVSGSATNAPAILPVLQVTPGSIAYGTILSGTGKTNSFTVANAGNGDVEWSGERERALQHRLGRELQFGRRTEPGGGGGVQSKRGEQLQSECDVQRREWNERDGERQCDQRAGDPAGAAGDAREHRVWDDLERDGQDK